jgi:group I intron endonuclease
MKHYIYLHQNKINYKIYVGYSSQPERRWRMENLTANHPSDSQYDEPFYRAIRKYGWDNFTHQIIEEFDSKSEALEAEKTWIEFYKSNRRKYGAQYGYNLHEGGGMPPSRKGIPHTLEVRNKISESNSGQQRSEQQKKNISKGRTGVKVSDAGRKSLSVAHKGKTLSAETRRKVSDNNGRGMLGKHHTEDTKQLLSENSKGEHRSPTTEFKPGNKINQRLTIFEEQEIAKLWLEGVSKRELSRRFNIARSSINRITKRLAR